MICVPQADKVAGDIERLVAEGFAIVRSREGNTVELEIKPRRNTVRRCCSLGGDACSRSWESCAASRPERGQRAGCQAEGGVMQSDLGIDARRYQSWPARSASFSTSAGAAFSLPGGMRIVRNVNPAASRMRTTASSHVIPPAVSRIGTVPANTCPTPE